jgi:hypothetical protein
MTPILITLVPVREASNHLGELWSATVDGKVVVPRSARALRDCCRLILRDGADPEAAIIVRYYGDDSGAELRSTLRAGAELSPLGKVA